MAPGEEGFGHATALDRSLSIVAAWRGPGRILPGGYFAGLHGARNRRRRSRPLGWCSSRLECHVVNVVSHRAMVSEYRLK